MNRNWMLAFCLWGTLTVTPVRALDTVTEFFEDDPFWTSLNTTAVNDNYGYSAGTNNAGGSTGEIGGLFGKHDAFDSFCADTDLGGTLSALNPLHASGKISIDSSLNPQTPINIAFFDQTNPSKGGNALRINIQPGGGFALWLRLEIGKNLISSTTTGLVNGDYTWNMDWDPTGNGGLGSGTVTFNGVTPGTPASKSATLNIPMRNEGSNPEWIQEPILFNAFGFQNHDGEATPSGQYRVYADDLTYTVFSAPATTSAWGLPGSGLWTKSLNWDPGEVPYGNDRTATFGAGIVQNSTVFLDRDVTVKSVQLNNASFKYAIAGTHTLHLDAASGSASVNVLQGSHELQSPIELHDTTSVSTNGAGSLEFDGVVAFDGNTMNIAAGSNVTFQNIGNHASGGLLNNSGNLGGVGRINANVSNLAGGVVAPGNSAGTLLVDGAYSQFAASTLAVEIGGTAASAFDLLNITGSATLNGILAVSLIDGFSPGASDSFTVLTAAGGIVDNGIALGGPDGDMFNLSVIGNSLVLSAGLLGDYNQNDVVDAADYTVWRDAMTAGATSLPNDETPGSVTEADFLYWRAHFGESFGGGADSSLASVPEPASALLLMMGAIFVAACRGSRPRLSSLVCRPGFGHSLCRWCLILTITALSCCSSARAAIVGNSFNTDPLWTGNDNVLPHGVASKKRDDLNNYTYSPATNNAFGSPGEIGGYLGMNTFDSYYADTTLGGNVGGTFPLQQTLHAGGKLMVNSDHGPTWNMNIGFFDATDYSSSMSGAQESGSGDAIRFAIIEQSPDFRIRLEIRQQGNGYNGPVLAGPAGLLDGMYTWTMDYNPTGGTGGNGRLSLNMIGPTTISTFVDVNSTGKNIAMNLNAFGMTNYNSGVSRPDFNKHYTFLDDLTYTTNEAVDTEVEWAGPGYGSWSGAYNWRGTSRTDGGGFVPDGNNRSAIFGSNITADAIVFVDEEVTTRDIQFNNASHSYSVVGSGTVVLDHQSGGDAQIDVTAGQHQFQSKVRLATDALVDALVGTQLDFNNAIELDGHTLTLSGNGQVNINNVVDAGAGGMVINLGMMGGGASITGDLTSTGTLLSSLGGAGSASAMYVSGSADLSGILDVTSAAGSELRPGAEYTVLTAGSITNRGLQLAAEDANLFRLVVGDDRVVLQVAIPEPVSGVLMITGVACLATILRNRKKEIHLG